MEPLDTAGGGILTRFQPQLKLVIVRLVMVVTATNPRSSTLAKPQRLSAFPDT